MRIRAAAAGTAILAVVGLLIAFLALWPRTDTGSPIRAVGSGPSAALERRAPPSTTPRVERRDPTAPRAPRRHPRPERLEITSVGIDVTVKPVGVSPDGQMALPPNPEVLGWYRFGPSPGGGTGSAVVAGHLDSKRYGLGPLVGLREVDAGDTVGVTRSNGTRRSYTVVEVRRYAKQALPEALFARTGPERLQVITCGGAYLPDRGGYQENLVVTAAPR